MTEVTIKTDQPAMLRAHIKVQNDLFTALGGHGLLFEIDDGAVSAEVPLNLYHIRTTTYDVYDRMDTKRYFVRARREPTVNEILTRLNINLAQIYVNAVDYPIWDLPEEECDESL